jgi:hypothetical protein
LIRAGKRTPRINHIFASRCHKRRCRLHRRQQGEIRTMALCRIAVLAAFAWPQLALGAPAVITDSSVFVERRDEAEGRRLETADRLGKGDRVVTILRWQRPKAAGGFTIVNPLPRALSYQQSSRANELVSVDGGRTWGRLGLLKIGERLASPEDVTHVRWRIPQRIAALGRGQIAYSGIVR